MPRHPMHEQIAERSAQFGRENAEARRLQRRLRPNEPLASLVLGCLAVGLGGVALTATLAGLAGVDWASWTEPRAIVAQSARGVWTTVATIYVPSRQSVGIATVGAVLGAGGLVFGWTRRRLSPLSLAGLLISIYVCYSGMLYEAVANLFY